MPTRLGIYVKYFMALYGSCIHVCGKYEVTAINHLTGSIAHIFVPLYYYSRIHTDFTLVHKELKRLYYE